MKEQVLTTKGDAKDTIGSLIVFLEKARAGGATHYEMEWSNDPMWAFKWLRTYRQLTDSEVKQRKIDAIKKELNDLEDS